MNLHASGLMFKVAMRNFTQVFRKQCHEATDDYKFPATANETLSEKTFCPYVMTIEKPLISSESPAKSDKVI